MKQLSTLLLTAFTSVVCLSASAQGTAKIRGSVADGELKRLSAATISLLNAKDSSLLKLAAADKEGNFEIETTTDGKYLLLVSASGHEKKYSKVIDLEGNKSAEVGTISLPAQVKALGAVTVTARKPVIEQKVDRTVLNVEASISNIGATALEVLEKAPGVTVDKDGNISLKGKQGVTIMMDGRPAYLSGAELSNYLKSLPATAIEQIEIMTNPSAKYDAAGNSGIINIKSKKNKQTGFNGSFTAGISRAQTTRANNSVNLNYRTGKVNVFANANVSNWRSKQQLDILRRYKNAQTGNVTAIFEQTSHMFNSSDNYSLKFGADYYLNKKTTLGVVTSGFLNDMNFNSSNTSFFKNPNAVTDSLNTTKSDNNNLWKNGAVNLNLRHQFDSTGRELTTDLDFVRFSTGNKMIFKSTSFDNSWNETGTNQFRGYLPTDISIYTAKMDYAQTLKKDLKFEAGLKGSFVSTLNEANYFSQNDGKETIDYRKTNNFLYEEKIGAAYINFNKQYKKWGVQTGLRYEYTSYNGDQYGNPLSDSTFSRSYSNLFPTAFVSYNASKNNQFGLSFGRRIDRPAYQDLNPFMFYIDEYTYQSGNPYLKPQFTNNVELRHTFKQILTTTVNYSITNNYMNETFSQGDPAKGESSYTTIVRRGNIGKKQNAGIALSANIPVRKWWNANLYSNFNYTQFSGSINGSSEQVDVAAANLLFNMNNSFRFDKGWGAELSGFYRTKGVDGQILIKALGQLSAGVSKQVLNGKGTVKAGIRDIFLTNNAKGEINFQTTEAKFTNHRDSRVANLTFTYRFGKPIKNAAPRRKIGGADDETNRVKVGNN